jgi:hypothetical protein
MNIKSKNTISSIIVGLGLFLAIPAGATDYQAYSLDELNSMRGTMTAASTEDREAFRSARQSKMQALTPDERSSYQSYGNNKSGNGNGNGNRMQARDGSGSGSMHRYQNHGSSGGGGMGSGGQHRGGGRR